MKDAYNFKIVLLGEGCVGKTSLVLRYVQDCFNGQHCSTTQASYLKKTVHLETQQINLEIWDTAGQEMFHALGPIYYRNSNGALLVYDITDEDSFCKAKNWVKELQKTMGDEVALILVGNKSDLENERAVPKGESELYARSVGAKHVLTSAKLDRGVREMFLLLCKDMLEKSRWKERHRREVDARSPTRLRLRVEDEDCVEASPSRKCCL